MSDANPEGNPLPRALRNLGGQPRVQRFLGAAVRGGSVSHAYLFLGAPGAGKLEAARALAQCVVCPAGGCGSCDECVRVAHGTHPDVHVLRPESSQGYLVDQARLLVDDVQLAPVRAAAKVYVLEDAGLLRAGAANALLKTIEEPPSDALFILIARTLDAVLPTIASRCQHVPFSVPEADAATKAVERICGTGGWEAEVALAVAGTPDEAASFLRSAERRACRRLVVRTLGELARDDSWDVIVSAREIVGAVRAPVDMMRARQDADLKVREDFLATGALHRIEDANKRALTARERSGMMEVMATVDSLLRDILLRCAGAHDRIVNEDVSDVVDRMAAATSTSGVLRALSAVDDAVSNIRHNVNPQLAIEVMLFNIKEALHADRPSGEISICGS